MPRFTIVACLGRPSANTRDYFNSIKFATWDCTAKSRSEAMDEFSPNTPDRPETKVDLSDGYEVLNWHAFEEETWR